jgi:DNA polymerase III sliding clamp (beta) subunit (PCNA family)
MKNIVETLITIQKAACKEETRYFLTGPCIDIFEGKLRIRATGGPALAQVLLDVPDGFSLKKPFIVDPGSIKMLKTLFTANKKSGWEIDEIDEGGVEKIKIAAITSDSKQSVILQPIDGEYPDTDRVWPSHNSNFKIGLNPKLLFELCEAMRREKNCNVAELEFCTDAKLGAIKVTFHGSKGLIMPMRI